MGPKKNAKEQQSLSSDKNKASEQPRKSLERPNHTNTITKHETQKAKNKEKSKDSRQESRNSKPLNKKPSGKESQSVKWKLEGGDGKYYESEGNMVTLIDSSIPVFDYSAMAMLMEDGAGPAVSGDHFWTAHFGGTESGGKFFSITNSRWFKEKLGLHYSGTLSKMNGTRKVELGPVINSGDVIGALCSFSEKVLKVYFYHNGRCLGLSFQVPASLFLPEGIFPCVKLGKVGAWATIKKEPKEKIPKEKDRVRAPAAQFGAEGIWRFKSLVDSASGNDIPLNVKEKDIKTSTLEIWQEPPEDKSWLIQLAMTHFVLFVAEKKKNGLWTKTESHHVGGTMERPLKVYDHSLFGDYPILEILNNPEKVDFQDQDMSVSKSGRTAIFKRLYRIRKGNVFKQESFD